MSKYKKPTWLEVVNNLGLKLISTGQLPLVVFLLLLVFLIYRTPQDRIADVWVFLGDMLSAKHGLGYLIGAFSTGGWAIHARRQRRRFERELDRVSTERNEAQQAHFKKTLKSSEGG